jgi:hypothetical protein
MSAADDLESEVGPATQASRQAQVPAQLEFVDAEDDDEEVLEVEPEPAGEEELARHRAAVRARASTYQSSLHTLLQIESLSRTTGVFLVVSGDDGGYLHLVEGELMHAETGRLSGEAAALEILSWRDASLEPSLRTLAPVRTVHSSLHSLLAHSGADVGSQPGPQQASHVVSRSPAGPLDQDAPTETYLPPVSAALVEPARGREAAPGEPAPPEQGDGSDTISRGAASPVAASPDVAAPRSVLPPPLPRSERETPSTVADVVLSAAGEMVQGRGAATEELAARVAYAARLAELIGKAIRSGTPRAVELRGKTTQTLVRWQGDGNLSASLDLPQPSRR